MRAIAPSTHHVHDMLMILQGHKCGEFPHHLGGRGNLAYRFLLHPQPDDETRDLRRGKFAAHDLPHDMQHFIVEDFAVLDGTLDRLCDSDFHFDLPSRKFFSMACPCSVSRASGWNWTPSAGKPRWRRPMISPSSDSAVISRQAGSDFRSTASEW